MRSSKSRSRSKGNRNNRSVGNIVNRVFDSSGPDGKVRGTPQQIIEKYNQLTRDAQLGNDRVAAENFQQHAEHYLRMLSAATKEQEARREEQERQNRERQAERDRERTQRQDREPGDAGQADQGKGNGNVVEMGDGGEDSGLVETPESKSDGKPETNAPQEKPKRPRKPRAKKADAPKQDGAPDQGQGNSPAKTDNAAE
ncbi:DUF4167 domain-containing protein [Lutimaribacter sp. EGI FJ00015]|uniref:DUF4167 domain-containing protein n=1 Tax=Lutimaribacter degradans TaxID=2945989 RepID=A0ACC5ZSC8_9RHOB|nr:DUF4167 domain-containing protein [Lutimaribacter sp. EGI FJ00013]MCM2561217.1 DUF4167 domain-containing protein [Lutimaribacter sp. EGI FJ00013]MCO0611834.1 DUF4167 domain-containing protein [Lutimaribacter sp. EGI FJ00015]MCO0635045.1 DUF4167 domain-containing protein [Lutimaribacter sp. EGI FJ00014]